MYIVKSWKENYGNYNDDKDKNNYNENKNEIIENN